MAVLKPTPNGYYLWDYVPSRPAAGVFAALFVLGTLGVMFQSFRTKTKFAIPFIIGGLFQVAGYAARAAAQDITDQLAPFIAQYILILVAPALFAASIYMILGRVIRSVQGEHHSPISPLRLTRIFVWGDVISFFTQVIGGSLQAMKRFNPKTAEYIVLAGLGIQIFIFSVFIVVAFTWHSRMNKSPTAVSSTDSRWKPIMFMLYGASILIMVRSVFRIIEYAMGREAYLLQNEWTMYVFDSALMVITVAVFAWWYPGLLRGPKKSQMMEERVSEP